MAYAFSVSVTSVLFETYLMMILVHSKACLYLVVITLVRLSVMEFLTEGNQCNFDINVVGPYRVTHMDPAPDELHEGKVIAQQIKQLVLDNTYAICGKIFNYRINTSESLLQNLYDFFHSLLYTKMHLYYSPQYGFSFWPNQLGFVFLKEMDIFFKNKNKLHIFFEDFITETTTFVRYHNQYRFDYMFGGKFKLQFIKNCVSSLIAFGDSIGIKWLMVSLLRSTFDMLYIRKLSV